MEAVNADAPVVSRRKRELYGVLWSFVALFFALGLLSYSPKDPCPFIREGLTGPVTNWMGPLGAAIAGWIYTISGFSAWLIPPALGAFAYRAFSGKWSPFLGLSRVRLALRGGGASLLFLSAAVFLELSLTDVGMDGERVRAGGLIGRGLGAWLSGSLGYWGALFLGGLLTVLGLMAAIDFSPIRAARRVSDWAGWGKDYVSSILTRRREAQRRHEIVAQERRVIKDNRTHSEIKIVIEDKPKPRKKRAAPARQPKQEKFSFAKTEQDEYELPSTEILDDVSESKKKIDQDALLLNAQILENKFKDFGVKGEVVKVQPGPVVTMYEYKPGPGIKINKIANLADDLAMALSAMSVRIIAPIPGKDVVGIEISNRDREMVYLREIIESDAFSRMRSKMPMVLGKDTTGDPETFDMRKAPHLLVAGSTGAGKSVSLNAMIMSVLYRATPHDVRLLMVDPKRLELSIYEGVPHLIHPVISDPKDAALALKWAVAEMERRYKLLAAMGVRHVDSYNKAVAKLADEKAGEKEKTKAKAKSGASSTDEGDTVPLSEGVISEGVGSEASKAEPAAEVSHEHLPLLLIIIDELADLMMVAAKDIEASICRLAQMARACGIHLILATQRPSVDVITGLIKANFPCRIAFKVASKTDSRTILDQNGAERLLGQGDMLFLGPGTSDLQRLHGAFVSDEEIKRATEYWRSQGQPNYDEAIVAPRGEDKEIEDDEPMDDKYEDAIRIVVQTRMASISMIQRKLKIGYNRAARIIERMEADGIVGPSDGVKGREVLIDQMDVDSMASM